MRIAPGGATVSIPHNLELGEAMLGDHEAFRMSEQEYRTAKNHLRKWELATFRATTKGTIGKLTDTRLFDVLNEGGNERINTGTTIQQRANNGPTTTNESVNQGSKIRESAHYTLREVLAEAKRLGIEPADAQNFFDHHENNNLWENRHGRLIKLPGKLKNWIKHPGSVTWQKKQEARRSPESRGSTLSQTETILRDKELQEAERAIRAIEDVDPHIVLSGQEKARLTQLKARRDELKQMLGWNGSKPNANPPQPTQDNSGSKSGIARPEKGQPKRPISDESKPLAETFSERGRAAANEFYQLAKVESGRPPRLTGGVLQ